MVFAALLTLGSVAAAFFYARGNTLDYGDAEAHLNTARRIIDSRTPGYEQIGTPWLPLPHVLMLPFVGDDHLWQTGLAGTIPAVFCFAVAGTFLFLSVRLLWGGVAPGLCAAAVFALNPNLLYLQSTPMTEPVLFATFLPLLYFTLLFGRTQHLGAAAAAGLCAALGTLTRYDAWFPLPLVALYILISGGAQRWRACLTFCTLAGAGPLYWLAHNHVFEGDALAFYRGPWSHRAIYQRFIDAGGARYGGDHDWSKAWLYYRSAAEVCAGSTLFTAGAVGLLAALWRRAWMAVALLLVLPLFYVLSMYSGGTPIFLPHLWPSSYYNARYGVVVLPLLALGCAGIVAALPQRVAPFAAASLIALSIVPWLAYPHPNNWIVWKEGNHNHAARRAWTAEVAELLQREYRRGTGILFTWGDMTGVLRAASIPLKETLNDTNGPHFAGATARPDLFLWEEWVLATSADAAGSAMMKTAAGGRNHYELVRRVQITGANPIEVYRRTHADPLHQSARRTQ